MNNKNVIFFTHHKNDEFTFSNFNKLIQFNKNWDVIPVGFKQYSLIPNSLHVDKTKYPSNEQLINFMPVGVTDVEWSEPDLLFYESFFNYPFYEKYFFLEWDCVFNVGVDEFFPTNEFDFFGNNIEDPASEDWEYVKVYRKYGGCVKSLASYGQSCCVFFTNKILKQVSNEVVLNKHLYKNMLSELRGGTLTKKFTDIKRSRNDIKNYIYWRKDELIFRTNSYFYHPIKNFYEAEKYIK